MISDIKRTSHHAVIITNYAIWHQSLKSIHYRILLIFQTKKQQICGSKHGGDKRHVIPPCQNMGGIHTPHPPGIYALVLESNFIIIFLIEKLFFGPNPANNETKLCLRCMPVI